MCSLGLGFLQADRALPPPLWHLLLDGGLLVEGMGCKASVRTVASGTCGGLTMRALPVVKAQPHTAPE